MSVTISRFEHTIILTDKRGTELLTFRFALSLQKVTSSMFDRVPNKSLSTTQQTFTRSKITMKALKNGNRHVRS